jgi:hypothetical protein
MAVRVFALVTIVATGFKKASNILEPIVVGIDWLREKIAEDSSQRHDDSLANEVY